MSMTKDEKNLRGWLVAVVVLHCAVSLWHGADHLQVPVPLTSMQTAFVAIVIMFMPFVGVGLLWTSRIRLGAWVIAVSMFASLVFGFLNHFVLDSPDYVMAVPEHEARHSFVLTAALLIATETLGAVLGTVAALQWRRRAAAPTAATA